MEKSGRASCFAMVRFYFVSFVHAFIHLIAHSGGLMKLESGKESQNPGNYLGSILQS